MKTNQSMMRGKLQNPMTKEEFKKFCKDKGYQVNKLAEIIINDFLQSTFRIVNNKSLSNDSK